MKNELLKWLRANLGRRALAPLTGYDTAALVAAYAIAEAMCNADHLSFPTLQKTWGMIVRTMQETTRHLAYHAIAKARDWSDRESVWLLAGMGDHEIPTTVCAFGPGGDHRDRSKDR